MDSNMSQGLSTIEIYHRIAPNNMEINLHFHNSYEMIYVQKGKAIFKINNKTYEAKPGSIILISNLEKHELKVIEYPYERYYMLINPDFFISVIRSPILTSVFRHRPEHFSHLLDISNDNDSEIEKLLGRILDEAMNKRDFSELSEASLLNLLLISLYRDYTSFFPTVSINRTTDTILKIQKYIDENSQIKLSLKDIAKQYYIDMYYLSRIFKNVTGYSFKEYIILQRISKAKNLLFFTNEDITQVGMLCGFNNTNHFIKLFKKYEAITPYQYRKQMLKQKI